ncbi:MAG: cation-translocating P-type ATPase family protein [Candidatus Sumerlaeota bacterium]|nr:cation-translocating P-type ATPase family protein [Candidatus Sumerlaeota bacterium]
MSRARLDGLKRFFKSESGRTTIELIVLAALLFMYWMGLSGRWPWAPTAIYGYDLAVILTFIAGRHIFWDALTYLLRLKISSDLAVALAAAAALYLGKSNPTYYFAAFEVIFIMRVGGFLEELAVEKTRSAVERLGELFPARARVVRNGREILIDLKDLKVGETIRVNPGERIPADARVTKGQSAVDQSTLTGEPLPEDKKEGDEIFAGTMNLMGALEAEVVAVGEESSLGKIIHLVESTEKEKAPIEKLADRYARFFVPVVLVLAGGTFFFTRDIVRSVAVMIIACPCAMVLATPTAVAAGIGRLALSGVLVKGGQYLELLGRAATLAIDKTGTLTRGRPKVLQVLSFGGRSETDVLARAATAEQRSEHPIGRILCEEAARRGLAVGEVEAFEAIPGRGVRAVVGGRRLLAGNAALLEENGIGIEDSHRHQFERLEAEGATIVLIVEEGELLGAAALGDEIRSEASASVRESFDAGMDKIVLLTGDGEGAARAMAARAGIAEWASRLLPGDKVDRIRQLRAATKRPVAFLGDGVNDAPAMAAADVGIAMGEIGSDITVGAAQVVFTADDLEKLPLAIAIARGMMRTIRVNFVAFAIVFNAASVAAAALGKVSPVWASVVHQISSLLVVCNSLRLFFAGRWEDTLLGRWNQWLGGKAGAAKEGALEWLGRFFSDPEFKPRGRVIRRGLALGLIAYVVWGWVAIQPGEVGLHLHFGRRKLPDLAPGLHLTLPWPFDRVVRVRPEEARRVEIGYRAGPAGTIPRPSGDALQATIEWESVHQSKFYNWVPDESILFTGDENIVTVTMTVQYRVKDPAAYALSIANPDAVIRDAGEAMLRSVVSRTDMDSLLVNRREELERSIQDRLSKTIEPYGIGVELTGVRFQDVHPAPEVIGAYREVASALEEKSRIIHYAEGERNRTLPMARAEANRMEVDADIYRIDKDKDASGQAERFAEVAKALATGARATTMIRRYYQAVEGALAGKALYVRDSALGKAYRLVLSDEPKTVEVPVAAQEAYPTEASENAPLAPAAGQQPAAAGR